jgi:hypothetical protein
MAQNMPFRCHTTTFTYFISAYSDILSVKKRPEGRLKLWSDFDAD